MAMIYRKTRKPWAGCFYKSLSDRQSKQIIRRWEHRMKEGSIKGCEVWGLMLHKENPEWKMWRHVTRIRRGSDIIEVSQVVPLPPSTKLRAVKRKPAPVS